VGKLCTVFSAPDYPQFVEEGEQRYNNQGAYVVLTAPGEFCDPAPRS
jgi:serine/threonine-protein phosphatase 5